MLSTTLVHRCPHCGGERLYKNGHTVRGAQRAKCKDCQRTFTLSPKGPRHNSALKAQVLAAYQDRMSLRGIHRTFGVCHQTVMKWLGEKNQPTARLEETLLPSQKGDVLELDELWSFVQQKTKTCWLWVALCRRTRQIVAYTLGDRSLQNACELRASHSQGLSPPKPPAATSGKRMRQPFPPAPTAPAAKRKGKPTMWNAGLAPCGHASAAWSAKRVPSPSASKITSTPSTSLSPATISKSNRLQHQNNHHRRFFSSIPP